MLAISAPAKARCVAVSSQTGLPCKKAPIRGATVCRNHGGAAPQVKLAAARRLAEQDALETAAKLGIVNVRPTDAIQEAIDIPSRVVAAILARLARTGKGLADLERAESELLQQWLDRQLRASKVATEMGLEERKLQLRSAELARVGQAVRDAITRPEFGLSEKLQKNILGAVAQALAAQGSHA